MSILSRLKNLFKLGQLLSVDDSGNVRLCTAKYLGKTQQIVLFTPYGLMHNPPVDSVVCVADQLAQASNGVGVADDPTNRIFKNLKEGEVAVGNYKTGDYTKYDEDGTVTTKTAGATIKAQADGRIEMRNTTEATEPRFIITADGELYVYWSSSVYIKVDSGGIHFQGNVTSTGTFLNNTVNVGSTHVHLQQNPTTSVSTPY